jgi:hypothetical protein
MEIGMTRFRILSSAALVLGTLGFVGPALAAPPVIEDPGYCAKFYPNANCQNYGPGNPYTDGGYRGSYDGMYHRRWHPHHRHHHR